MHVGIFLSYEKNLFRLIIEGDSKHIIDILRNVEKPSWTIQMEVEESRRRIVNWNVTSIYHIFREGNQEEDGLANLGV